LDDAKKIHEQALSIRDKLGEKTTAEESRVSLAKLSLIQGRTDVENSLRDVLSQAVKQKEPEIETFARITLSTALVQLGKPAEAAKEISPSEEMAKASEERLHRIDVFLAAAQVRAALGEQARAERMLSTAISESNQMGCMRCQLESRLALGQLKAQRKDKNVGAMIAALKRDASKLGFMLIVRQAALLHPQP
jgi:ATP/maltotriose-dependent transcriptional regulator MalT